MAGRRLAAALLLAAALALGNTVAAEESQSAYDEQLKARNGQLEQLQEERRRLDREIDAVRDEKERESAEREGLDRQIRTRQREIDLLQERRGLMAQELERTAAEADSLQADIQEREEAYKKRYQEYLIRLRGMQMWDGGSLLDLLLGSESLADYLAAGEMMARVADHDRQLIRQIQGQRETLELDREALERQMRKVEEDRDALGEEAHRIQTLQGELAEQKGAVEQKLHDIRRMEEEYLADMEHNRRAQEQIQAELDRILREIEWSRNPYAGGRMLWPVAGYNAVSSGYGPRFGYDFHSGVDIYGTGIEGEPVLAANDGVVSYVNWTYQEGKGYGIYLMIDHGVNGEGHSMATLYAHLSSIQVEQGQSVERGQAVGAVGNTGWSTGPHLHFEVRVNKKYVNPMPYLMAD